MINFHQVDSVVISYEPCREVLQIPDTAATVNA